MEHTIEITNDQQTAAGPALIPHFIQQQHALGNFSGQFQAVCLFVDLSGFSAVTHALAAYGSEAAEVMAEIMLNLFTPLVEQVYGQGGYITTFAGDAFTALFPLDVDEPRRAYRRALAAAVGIQQHLGANPVQDTVYGRFPFAAKLGLGLGAVDWGILEPAPGVGATAAHPLQAAYYFSGPAIESAAAAEHQAQSGNLILAPALAEALSGEIKTLPAGELGHRRWLAAAAPLMQALPLDAPAPLAQRAFIPAAILNRSSRGEFRQIISVFINLLGIDSSEQLALFMQSVFELQGQYGGYLNRVDFGDKGCNLLLFWGMPVSTENDLERALNFMAELPAVTSGSFRAGVTYRAMYAGLAGSERRAEFTCYGDGVNLAARLMMQAPWGEIWLDEPAYRRAGRRFAAEARGEFAFKGFDEPLPAFCLLERGQAGLNLEQFYQEPLVGRLEELETLERWAEPLFQPQAEQRFAGAMLILGEAGIGKSRLATEFVLRLQKGAHTLAAPALNPQVFVCQTDPTAGQTLTPFRSWLLEYFQQSATQSEARNKRAFSRKLDELIMTCGNATLSSELNRLRSCLGALLNLSWENSLYTQLDARARYENTLIALKDLLLAECLRRPVVLYIEDVHWLDDDSRQFLSRLTHNIDAYPLAILATSRPCRDEPFVRDLPQRSLTLSPFGNEDLLALAQNRLNGPLDSKLIQFLSERSEGVPFIAEQILHFLNEHNGLQQKDGVWRLARSSKSLLPTDVSAIFTAQLDSLPAEVKDVMLTAAVLGREFQAEILAAVYARLQPEQELAPLLAAAQGQSICLPTGPNRYLFKHTMMRDAAYEMQLRARRRELHRYAAEAYLAAHPADAQDYYGKIGQHYEAAVQEGLDELRPLACDYLLQAGRRAAEKFENTAAVDCFSRVLNLLPQEALSARFEALLGREEIYQLRGERAPQVQDLQSLQELADALKLPANQAVVALRRARHASATTKFDEALQFVQQAVRFAQIVQDAGLEAWACHLGGIVLMRQARYDEARQQYTQCCELAAAVDDLARQGDAMNGLGNLSWFTGALPEARQYYLQAEALFEAAGRRREGGVVMGNLAIILYLLDRQCDSLEYFHKALAVARQVGDRVSECNVLGNLGQAALGVGDYVQARAEYQQSLSISREVGNRNLECIALYNLANAACLEGQFSQALPLADQALDLARQIKNRATEGQSLQLLGELFLQLGDWETSQSYFEQALALHMELKNEQRQAENQAGLARLWLAQGNLEQALLRVEQTLPALEKAPALDKAGRPIQVYLGCYQVLQAANDSRAAALLAAAQQQVMKRAAAIDDEELRRSYLEQVPENRAILGLGEVQAAPLPRGEEVKDLPPAPFPKEGEGTTAPVVGADNVGVVGADGVRPESSTPGDAARPEPPQGILLQVPLELPVKPKQAKKKGKKKKAKAAQTVINIKIVIYPGQPPRVEVESD